MITIYLLKDNGNPFYVGQTIDIRGRMYNHRSSAKYQGTLKETTIYDIIKNGRDLTYEILEICEDCNALIREHFHITSKLNEGVRLINEKIAINPKKRKDYSGFDSIDLNILQYLADGLENKPISILVGLSVRTVESRVGVIKNKLNVQHLGGLIKVAYYKGLIL